MLRTALALLLLSACFVPATASASLGCTGNFVFAVCDFSDHNYCGSGGADQVYVFFPSGGYAFLGAAQGSSYCGSFSYNGVDAAVNGGGHHEFAGWDEYSSSGVSHCSTTIREDATGSATDLGCPAGGPPTYPGWGNLVPNLP